MEKNFGIYTKNYAHKVRFFCEKRQIKMNEINEYTTKLFEDIKHIDEYGNEYWLAREAQLKNPDSNLKEKENIYITNKNIKDKNIDK